MLLKFFWIINLNSYSSIFCEYQIKRLVEPAIVTFAMQQTSSKWVHVWCMFLQRLDFFNRWKYRIYLSECYLQLKNHSFLRLEQPQMQPFYLLEEFYYLYWSFFWNKKKPTFSMAFKEYLFLPFLKYFSLVCAHGTLSPAVRAPKYFSQ